MLNKALIVSSIFALTFSAAHAQTDQQGSTPSSPPPKPPPSTGATDDGDLYPFESTVVFSSEALGSEADKTPEIKIAPTKPDQSKPVFKTKISVAGQTPSSDKNKVKPKSRTKDQVPQKPKND